MKKLFLLFAAVLLVVGVSAQLKLPHVIINGQLADYNYFYVVPTAGVTSSSGVYGNQYGVYGGQTKTIVPSEVISGYLMKNGHNVLPSIKPELASKTLIFTYGYTGRRPLSLFAYASCIIIQIRDAATQDLVASIETEGCGSDETEDILDAIYSAMDMYQYSAYPKVDLKFIECYKRRIYLLLTNKTRLTLKNVTLHLKYYLDGELMHEQTTTIKTSMNPGDKINATIKRDKEAQNKKYAIKVDIVAYN